MKQGNAAGIPERKSTRLLVIDLQERLMPVIHQNTELIQVVNKLIAGMEILQIPTVVTEQYPKGLGNTHPSIELPGELRVHEKICFSCIKCNPLLQELQKEGVTDLVLCGVEAHICVLQTALDALNSGFRVHVVADAVSSRFAENKTLALKRMQQSGAYIVSLEMILFLLMEEAGNEEFKAISNLIK
nr:hydrolase [Saprospiraceae bacterium]